MGLSLRKGEVLGLIGESGAGKSSIGLSSMCYARAGVHIAGGEVILDGVNIRALDAEGRRYKGNEVREFLFYVRPPT